MSSARRPDLDPNLGALVDELVDAHMDTIQMTLASEPDPDWHQHALYLQRLVREAHKVLAAPLTNA